MSDDKLMDRVRKLLALAQSSNPHEAAAAMAKAKALMDEHRLTMTDLERATIGQTDIRSRFSVSKMKPYELVVVQLAAKAFGGEVLWRRSSSHRSGESVYGCYTLVAPKAELEVASWMVNYLLDRLQKGRAEFVSSLSPYLPRDAKIREADGFCTGWTLAVGEKLRALAGDTPRAAAVVDYIRKNILPTYGDPDQKAAMPQRREVGDFGAGHGQRIGAKESVSRPIDGTGAKPLRLS